MDSQKGSVKMVEFVGVGEREKKIKVLNNNSDAKKVHRQVGRQVDKVRM